MAEEGHPGFLEELEDVSLAKGARLARSGGENAFVWFPLTGLISVVGNFGGTPIEVGIVGPESMIGMRAFFGGSRLPVDVVVQVPGTARRLRADRFAELIWADPAFYGLFLPFVNNWLYQIAETATSNARYPIRQRVVRRILMSQDRLRADTVPVTHAGLASALAVRRASVTVTLNELAQDGLVENGRGLVRVLKRPELIDLVGSIYTPLNLPCSG